ncbi:uncharacterized protein BYT42DRAFT_559981 [Radiomyces spectabilis]|uniref:uncharacterized protein n=1 Tax=Radiomyces spectabilis TaxID=64574 RepID=UPI00221FA6A5|nr:uncharacterized protein BYT42DRAFT_559981 [Radiomyces spectabilis]KAI8388413.1 hypothetical protein BYT42DRAFT_559981 [Radiomyces spectabilis]
MPLDSASTQTTCSSSAEEQRLKTRYNELKRKIAEVEQENKAISIKLREARKSTMRLRLERTVLLERLHRHREEKFNHSNLSKSRETSPESIKIDRKLPDQNHAKSSPIEPTPADVSSENKASTEEQVDPEIFALFCRLEQHNVTSDQLQACDGNVNKAMMQLWKQLPQNTQQMYCTLYRSGIQHQADRYPVHVARPFSSPMPTHPSIYPHTNYATETPFTLSASLSSSSPSMHPLPPLKPPTSCDSVTSASSEHAMRHDLSVGQQYLPSYSRNVHANQTDPVRSTYSMH